MVEKKEDTKEAWKHSNISLVVEAEGDGIVGCIRGFTETRITLYICELLIDKRYRGAGIGESYFGIRCSISKYENGTAWLRVPHIIFMRRQGYRPFYGFRKTFEE